MDRQTVQRLIIEIELELRSATDDDRRYLQQALDALRPLLRPPAEREEFMGVPRALVLEMFQIGRNPWIAELVGCSVAAVRSKRTTLGIATFSHGGDPNAHERAKAAWLAEWRPRLEALGWKPPERRAG